jgi:hypothetical protein
VDRTRKSDIGPSCTATRNPKPKPTRRACMASFLRGSHRARQDVAAKD